MAMRVETNPLEMAYAVLLELTFQVPQVRKGTRTDQAVHLALAEMYVQGVSTRRVIEVLQRLLSPTRIPACAWSRRCWPNSTTSG